MKLKTLAIPTTVIVLAVLAWVDTMPYRTALSKVPAEMPVSALAASKKDIEADLQRWTACNNMRKENPDTKDFDYTPEGRMCLLAAMPKTKTTMGAIVFATSASVWLTAHPADTNIRLAALAAINNGRSRMITSKSWYYDTQEKVAEAHDRSVILKLRDGRQNASSLFDVMANKLDQAEYAVMLPDVVWKQKQWRLKALTGKEKVV